MKDFKPVVVGIIALLGLGAGFGGGYFFRNYQLTKMRASFSGGTFRGMGMMGQPRRAGGGMVIGSIISQDDKSITVKMSDGSTKIVLLGSSTTYSNTVSASLTDLKVGSTVGVFGTANSDGSVTATTVQINPEFGRMMPNPTPSN